MSYTEDSYHMIHIQLEVYRRLPDAGAHYALNGHLKPFWENNACRFFAFSILMMLNRDVDH